MDYDRKECERLITESPLFMLDRETELVAYKREALKMVEYLYCYLLSVNERDYEPYGCEIMEVANRCIKNYDSSKGVFLHYFNAAWKQEFRHINGDKLLDERNRGLKLTEEEKRNIRKYLKLSEKLDTSFTREEVYKKISEAMDLSVDKIMLLDQLSNLYVSSDRKADKDGEELSIWDVVTNGQDIESELEEADSVLDLLNKVEKTYLSLQERQKPIVSDMITIRIWELIPNIIETGSFSFISNRITEEYAQNGSFPTQRQIADEYNRNEASISRTLKEFLARLRLVLMED